MCAADTRVKGEMYEKAEMPAELLCPYHTSYGRTRWCRQPMVQKAEFSDVHGAQVCHCSRRKVLCGK